MGLVCDRLWWLLVQMLSYLGPVMLPFYQTMIDMEWWRWYFAWCI